MKRYKQNKTLLLCVIVFTLLFLSQAAGISLEVQSTDLWGLIGDAAVDGNYIYCNMRFGLLTLDVSTPSSPVVVSRLYVEGFNDYPEGIAVSDGFAYLLWEDDRLIIIDISNPQNPVLAGEYTSLLNPEDIAVKGDFAYVTEGGDGLQILNISNPASPSYVASHSFPSDRIEVRNDLAVVESSDSIIVFDVSSPSSPVVVGHRRLAGWGIYDLAFSSAGNHLFVRQDSSSADAARVVVLDISIPASLDSVATVAWPTGYAGGEIAVSDTLVFVGGYDSLTVVNMKEVTAPVIVKRWELPRRGRFALITGETLFLYSTSQGALTINVADPLVPVAVGEFRTYDLNDAVINGDIAYVADGQFDGLFVIDMANPQSPVVRNYVQLPDTIGSPREMAIAGDSVYVSCGSQVHIFDITDPVAPVFCPMALEFYDPGRLFVRGEYLYVADKDSGMVVCDLSATPTIVSRYRNTDFQWNRTWDVHVRGDTAIVLNGETLDIVNVADHTNPVFIGKYTHQTGAWAMSVQGEYIFAATRDSGLIVFDISNPLLPTRIGGCDSDVYSKDIAVYGDYAFLTTDTCGLRIENISDPAAPYFEDAYSSPYWGEALKVFGNYLLYVEEDGLLLFALDTLETPVNDDYVDNLPYGFQGLQNYPNPFNPSTEIKFELPRASDVRLEIFNILGQKVSTLLNKRIPAGYHSVNWDGSDFSSGIYLYRLQAGDFVESKKMMLIK